MNPCSSMFKPNEGKTDRIICVVLGVVLLGFALYNLTGIAQIAVEVVGMIALVTGAVGFCGLYKIFGISTLKKKN